MGILHSSTRFFGCKPEYEDSERPIYPYLIPQRQNDRCSNSSVILPKILSLGGLIYNAVKRLLRYLLPWPRRTADHHPILPVQNPASGINTESLLFESTLVSSSSNDSSAEWPPETATTAFASNADLEELQRASVGILSCQQWHSEENELGNRKETGHDLIVSIPDFTCSLAYTNASEDIISSAITTEENVSRNLPVIPTDEEEEEREEEKVMIKSVVVVDEGRWIKHYNSRHRILLVGEGDFSFSACLALAFECAANIIATSLDSIAFLKKNYWNALSNIEELRSRKGKVMHGIDTTRMADHPSLGHLKFDRIVFNFPFAGFFKDMPRDSQLRRHRSLVSRFLMNAKEMLSKDGEIHITHKTNGFLMEWKVESIASSHKLRLVEAVDFDRLDYPGYNTKYGFGGDNNFNCNPSKTYKFGV